MRLKYNFDLNDLYKDLNKYKKVIRLWSLNGYKNSEYNNMVK